jgi:hypothetical protein
MGGSIGKALRAGFSLVPYAIFVPKVVSKNTNDRGRLDLGGSTCHGGAATMLLSCNYCGGAAVLRCCVLLMVL